ncbi:hypothetical protein COY30_00750 [Candidatus Woesebacteria bacterium CG_4_10_14_0_2_um_filter_44_9]|uniref:Transcriptional regulator n=1 Tax=Candidatus Woesebacteria bacterium CG_4_10_14_0_2_um_filter_44_9 TaxID=1975055 RepID=A0A2M7TIF6_9BACT|nr:MAG: hypothetical protein COY30_00750 [Candidatus Woesebacteria bacterium CG_4_10_14_0_2_um_filter_44_9]
MSLVKDLTKNRKNQTVFTLNDIVQLAESYRGARLYSALKYAVKTSDLIRLSRGIYSLNREYSRQEFANKFRTPSYISLYTVLQEAGVLFQPYISIYLVSGRSITTEIDNQKYIYRKIKNEILLNPTGIITESGASKAIPERALCDVIYLEGNQYFDNLRQINWEKAESLNTEVYFHNLGISEFISKYAV